MNKKELQTILSKFDSRSGAQLKYYIIKSFFPTAKRCEIEEIGNFNHSSFFRIEKEVEEKGFELLVSTASEEVKVNKAESAELIALREENEKLKKDLERKSRIIQLEEQTISSYESKIADLKDFIRKNAENKALVVQCYKQAIEKLQEQGIEMDPIPLDPYRKEMKELLE